MENAFCKRQNKAWGCTFLCAKDQFTVDISQFTVNVYVRPDKVENIVKRNTAVVKC